MSVIMNALNYLFYIPPKEIDVQKEHLLVTIRQLRKKLKKQKNMLSKYRFELVKIKNQNKRIIAYANGTLKGDISWNDYLVIKQSLGNYKKH